MRIWPQLEFQLRVQTWSEAQRAIQQEVADFFGGQIPENLVVYADAEAAEVNTITNGGESLFFIEGWDIHVRTEGGKFDVGGKDLREAASAMKIQIQDLERESR